MSDDEYISTADQLYDRLTKYMWWMSHRCATGHILMQVDELYAELCVELVAGWERYGPQDLPANELLAVVRTMLWNRIYELRQRFWSTHRCVEGGMLRLEDEVVGEDSPATLTDSALRVDKFISSLTAEELEMLKAIMFPDYRVGQQIRLRAMRRSFVFETTTIKLDYRLMAEALHWPIDKAKRVWKQLKVRWRTSSGE